MICRSGRIEAAGDRGTMQLHALALYGELVWALPRLANRLSCELRPTGCHFVNAERLAELARSLVGLSGEPELSPTGLRFCLDATSPARQGLPLATR